MRNHTKIMAVEPVIFLAFGLFHLHRVWAFSDRGGYASFWLSVLEGRGWRYYLLFVVLAALCFTGIAVFVRMRGDRLHWRWLYVAGGAYLLFDLTAIQLRLGFWVRLLHAMFDTTSRLWPLIWGAFILLGAASFLWGLRLYSLYRRQRTLQAMRLPHRRVYELLPRQNSDDMR